MDWQRGRRLTLVVPLPMENAWVVFEVVVCVGSGIGSTTTTPSVGGARVWTACGSDGVRGILVVPPLTLLAYGGKLTKDPTRTSAIVKIGGRRPLLDSSMRAPFQEEKIMYKKLLAPIVTVAMSGALFVGVAAPANAATTSAAPASATSQATNAAIAPVSINQVLSDGSTLAGTFTPTQFVNQNGVLTVLGTFTGTLTSATGTVTQITNAVSSAGITNATTSGTCKVLDLTLGPLHLNLLGLVVDLNQVHLTINAQSGPGNLLGNLLCSVSNLLNGGIGLNGLTNLLNHLLGL